MYDKKNILKILEALYKDTSICSIKGEDLHYILKLANNYIEKKIFKRCSIPLYQKIDRKKYTKYTLRTNKRFE